MSFPYKHVLLIGATSGIGLAMANRLIASGVKVTAVGRRKERLNDFVSQHSPEKASSVVFDITALDKIAQFADSVLQIHPTIDCIFLNSGIQRHYNFFSPTSVSLSTFDTEMTTNFTSLVHLTHAFLPSFLSSSEVRGIIFTGTHISLVPVSPMLAYSASKAALGAFVMCLREQLKDTNVKITNLSPPLVQSEIHDYEMGPNGQKLGMPVSEFTDLAYKELASENEEIIIGSIGGSTREQFMEIVDKRREAFYRIMQLLEKLVAGK
ncbi:oxidoreductase [Lojkania enalia]|uniref:Oxidoreductase n=1 Tax=Lojkania enalia TaxID=147567 RepID=A0A9P4K0X1_9PLEO|nr:oxidoreductase [Didymosphaeria enalia]